MFLPLGDLRRSKRIYERLRGILGGAWGLAWRPLIAVNQTESGFGISIDGLYFRPQSYAVCW